MIIIIGAGLSGLLTAYRLKKEGIPCIILEARNRVGGRIHTVVGSENTPVEMGATWFTHQHKHLISLLDELKIEYFEQFMDSTVLFQSSPTEPIQRIQIPPQNPSYRISGGSSHLINTLYESLDKNDVLLHQTVKKIKFRENSVEFHANEVFEADQVVLAIPPKLWANNIAFEPTLSDNLMTIAKQTHTWMEDSIKIALTYKTPFWQVEKTPRTFFSHAGPITEFYDHCNHKNSKYALCGFIDSSFKRLNYTERKKLVINQVKMVFGEKAEAFMDYEECVWSEEEFTFYPSEVYPHQNNGNPIFRENYFDNKLLISSSESALQFPGYMEGSVYAANEIANRIFKAQQML